MKRETNHYRCPKCNSEKFRTHLNRKTKYTAEMWRRKTCEKCGHEFDTLERILPEYERPPEREW